jgi:hypothetical protein
LVTDRYSVIVQVEAVTEIEDMLLLRLGLLKGMKNIGIAAVLTNLGMMASLKMYFEVILYFIVAFLSILILVFVFT